MAHRTEELIRKATDALNAGDMQTFLGFHTEDVIVHVPGKSPTAGDHKGREELADSFQRMAAVLDAPSQFELHDVLANDEHGVILGTQKLRRGGKARESRMVLVLHVREGKFSEIWIHPEDLYADDEFVS